MGLGDVTCTSAGYIITIVQCDIYTGIMCNVYRRVIYVDDSIVVMVLAIV